MGKEPNTEQLQQQVDETEKPDLRLAMEIAQYVREEMKKMELMVSEQVRAATQATGTTVKRIEDLEGTFRQLQQDLEQRAAERANKDVLEAQARYQIALAHKDNLSTQERIEVGKVVQDQLTAARRARQDYWRAVLDKIVPNIMTGLVMMILGPVFLGLFIAMLIFILRSLGIAVPFPSSP